MNRSILFVACALAAGSAAAVPDLSIATTPPARAAEPTVPAKKAPAKKAKAKKPAAKPVAEVVASAEKTAPGINAARKQAALGVPVAVREGGVIRYPFGIGAPTLTCSPYKVCTLEFQPGETVQGVSMGDVDSWELAPPVKQGAGADEVVVATFKLKYADVSGVPVSNAVFVTDRRTYTITLTASPDDYMQRVGFYFPDDAIKAWRATSPAAAVRGMEPGSVNAQSALTELNFHQVMLARQKQAAIQQEMDGIRSGAVKAIPANTPIAGVTVDASKLVYSYEIDGDAPFKPSRVFSDGTRMFIQMPTNYAGDLPAPVVVDDAGREGLVNFRYREGFFVLDTIAEHVRLVSGTDKARVIVDIKVGA